MITRDPEKFAHHDRVFKNNPVVMQGMGLAPLVVLATSGRNAVMLAVAVALLLTPSRMLACLLSRLCPLRDERPAPEELEKKLLPRAFVYSGSAAVVYLAVYPILNALFGTDLLALGIYLPLLVVEPLLTYRFGRVQETVHKAVSKGVRITVGYALLLLVVGMLREWLSLGTVFGAPVGRWAAKRQIPAICCWRSCSRIRAQQRGFWQANRSVSRKCAVSWLRPAAPRPCIWTAMTLHRISGAPWTMPSSGRRTLT